jgi:hypothetical protein
MNKLSFYEILRANCWSEQTVQPFAEKVGNKADRYFTYQNKKDNVLAFAVFEKESLVRFRIFDLKTGEVAWFDIEIDSQSDAVIKEITAKQDEITQAEAFGFYFSISSVGSVAILAWEQFEENYN